MKIVVVADSHGNIPILNSILAAETPFEYLVHCGDGVKDLNHIAIMPLVGTIGVSGNMDLGKGIARRRLVAEDIRGRRFLVVHGDVQGAHQSFTGLREEARVQRCSVVLFGHTHRKYLELGDPVLFNPGPALQGMYGLVMVNEEITFLHRNLR